MSEEERIARHREKYMSRFKQDDVAKMFTESVEDALISTENRYLGNKINEMKDINYKSMDKNKRPINNTKTFMRNMENRYISREG